MGFSWQECWSGLPCPPLGDLPHPGIKPSSLRSPALAGGLFTTSSSWEAPSFFFAWSIASFPTGLLSLAVNPWEVILYALGTVIFLQQRWVNFFSKSWIPDISDLTGPFDLRRNWSTWLFSWESGHKQQEMRAWLCSKTFLSKNVTDLAHALLFAALLLITDLPSLTLLLTFCWLLIPKGKLSLLVWHASFLMVLCLLLQAHLFHIPLPYPLSQPFHFLSYNSEPHSALRTPCVISHLSGMVSLPHHQPVKLPLPFKTCLDVSWQSLCPFLISNCNHCLFGSISVFASLNTLWTPWKQNPRQDSSLNPSV